jgi:type VI secretion system secreted protein VgrG
MGNDVDRPAVIASLYTGRGESGVCATPALADSSDHRPSSKMNLMVSGSTQCFGRHVVVAK